MLQGASDSMKNRIHAIFKGRVQGVFFRDFTRRKSIEHGLCGWVRNLDNGDVEAVFEGDDDEINIVIDWLKTSHPHARVDNVTVSTEPFTGEFKKFDIAY
jgi:acylphosphatase